MSQQNPTSDAAPPEVDNMRKKRAKLVYQKASIDEESISQEQHDLSPDHQASHKQLPGNQDQTSHDLSTDHLRPHDIKPSDTRSPSFVSLSNEGFTVRVAKQRKEVALEQPLLEESKTPLQETKEDDPSGKEEINAASEILQGEVYVDQSKTPLGETKEDDPSSNAKDETDAPSEILQEEVHVDQSKTTTKEDDPSSTAKQKTNAASQFLQAPSGNQQQQRSLSVPSCPPQLKSILRRSNAPKSLSLDIHNLDDHPSSKHPPLQHRASVSYNYVA